MLITEIEDNGIKGLRSQIKKTVDKVDDTDTLNQVISVLEKSNLLARLEVKLKTDSDARKMYHHLAKVVVSLPGSLDDKQRFIENYEKGFVKTNKLLTKNRRVPLSEIIPDKFAFSVFDELKDISVLGVGPGEIALAALSPDIRGVGQKGGGGDLLVKGVRVELKGAREGGGRFHDAKKAAYDMASIQRALQKYYPDLIALVTEGKKSITGIDWIRDRDQSTPAQKKEVAKIIAESTFRFLKDNSPLVDALIKGDEPALRKAWAEASFENYKTYAKFDVMLMIDFSDNTSICFDQFIEAVDDLKIESIQIWGAEMTAVPKIRLKSTAKAATPGAAAEPQATGKGAAPAKPITARFEPEKANVGRSKR